MIVLAIAAGSLLGFCLWLDLADIGRAFAESDAMNERIEQTGRI